jgi:hypothetical protein
MLACEIKAEKAFATILLADLIYQMVCRVTIGLFQHVVVLLQLAALTAYGINLYPCDFFGRPRGPPFRVLLQL